MPRLNEHTPVILELGCGPRKRITKAIGIDSLNYENVDIVGDVFDVLARIPDGSINEIYSYHFFEHIQDLPLLIDEISRTLKQNGSLVVVVPHFSNPYFYSDYTHRTFFGLYSFSYFAIDKIFQRRVPNYKRSPSLELMSVYLNFLSPAPFKFRNKLKKLVGKLINSNNSMKEFYEENLCYLVPCYEIRYRLVKHNLKS